MGSHPFAYHPYYCEENIWHLAQHLELSNYDQKNVVFISNRNKTCAVWHMRAGQSNQPLIWDYHVILLAQKGTSWWVWDLDTTLGLPIPAETYFIESFRPVPAVYLPQFRVVGAAEYTAHFFSDRSHMLRNGQWMAPPPPWPTIQQLDAENEGGTNLMEWVSLESKFFGEVIDLPTLVTTYT